MSEINHDLTINAQSETIYHALTTPEGLQAWFTAHVKGSGKVGTNWDLDFTNQPFFSWQILTAEKSHIAWKCLQGPGNASGTEVEFTLAPDANKTILTISHRGWTAGDPKFTKCVDIWRTLMNCLQHYCETGKAAPAYQ